MKLTAIVDWYMLERLKAELLMHPPSEDDNRGHVIASQINHAFEDLTENLATALRDYLFVASVGEARHAWDKSNGQAPSDLPRTVSRSDAFDQALNYDITNESNVDALYQVFYNNDWQSGFGGGAWSRIVKAIKLYDKHKGIFIDHVADLHHNGGSLFDKDEAFELVDFSRDWFFSDDALQVFLSIKFRYDLLECSEEYLGYLAQRTRRLVWDFLLHFKRAIPVLPPAFHDTVWDASLPEWYDYEPVNWGTRDFSSHWVDTEDARCARCGDPVDEDDSYSYGDDTYCEYCYNRYFGTCDRCYDSEPEDNLHYVEGSGVTYCDHCMTWTTECDGCHEQFVDDDVTEYIVNGGVMNLCGNCEENIGECEVCHEATYDTDECGNCEKVERGYLPGQLVLPGLEVYIE